MNEVRLHAGSRTLRAGVPDAHFHDLRHTDGTLAATTGGDYEGTRGLAWPLQPAPR
jgi:hypothetical protein